MTVDSGEEFTVEVRGAFDEVEDVSAMPTPFTPACDVHPLAPIAGPIIAEAPQFMMLFGPLPRILPAIPAPQGDAARSALEGFFEGHASPQGVVLPAANWVVRGAFDAPAAGSAPGMPGRWPRFKI